MRSSAIATVVALVAIFDAHASGQTTSLQRLRIIGNEPGQSSLVGVRAADYRGDELVVVTSGAPPLHVFADGRRRTWGTRGRGPAELTSPQGVAWAGNRVLVRDSELRKLASFDRAGTFLGARPLAMGMAVGLQMAGRDTLVELFGGATRTVVRLRGARQDTVLRYTLSDESVELTAPGMPSLRIPAPFVASAGWAPMTDGRLAYWDGRESFIRVLDASGRTVARLTLPAVRYPISERDRAAWIASAIPEPIRGQDFTPLRASARETVRFPREFPPVLGLRADPGGGVWVLQTPSASGQRWLHLAEGQAPLAVQLPLGQTLLAVGEREMAALAPGGERGDAIHVYAKPRRAR